MRERKLGSWSGSTYVSAQLKGEVDRTKVPVASSPDRCEHAATICATRACIESWSIDYHVFLERTEAGRRIAREAGFTTEEMQALPLWP
jgi:hypothetical protein